MAEEGSHREEAAAGHGFGQRPTRARYAQTINAVFDAALAQLLDAWTATLHRDDPRSPTHTWYDVPVVTGRSVVLRPQRPSDADRIVEGCADGSTQRWLPFLPSPFTREDALTYIESGVEAAATGPEGLALIQRIAPEIAWASLRSTVVAPRRANRRMVMLLAASTKPMM